MVDSRFFKNAGPFLLKELADLSEAVIHNGGGTDIQIKDIAPIASAKEADITFFSNKKYKSDFCNTKASACIVDAKAVEYAPEGLALLVSENPYYSYSLIANAFYPSHTEHGSFFSPSASIASSAVIGKNCSIGDHVSIGENVVIGHNCIIHPSVTLQYCHIGDNVIIHPGVRIGQDGFGFASHKGVHYKVPQLGRVIIGNDVEIGANTTIDRGTNSDTSIGDGTKIDNLVQIGHNVEIGKGCMIVSQVGISGSTKIGNYVVLAGQVGVNGHLHIGDKTVVTAQSGVLKDAEPGAVLGGSPAVPLQQFKRQTIRLQQLVKNKS